MGFSGIIAWRYFRGGRKLYTSFMSLVAIVGVALGVFSLVVVMSVMTGFSGDLQKKLLGLSPHMMIDGVVPPDGVAAKLKGIIDSQMEVIEGEAVIGSGGGTSAQGVRIRGVNEADLSKLKSIDLHVLKDDGCVLGSELAYQLGVAPEFDDTVTLVSPLSRIGPTGDFVPSSVKCQVAGTFTSGYFEHDTKTVIMPRSLAARLLLERGNKVVYIWLKDISAVDQAERAIRNAFEGVNVSTWMESNKKLFSALKLERFAMTALLTLIIVTACISIVSVIFMFIFARRKDIAILSAIGAGRWQIASAFLKIGAYIGGIGTCVGMALSLAVCFYLKSHRIELPASYYLNQLPVNISPAFLVLVAIGAVVIAVACALYPSFQAVRLKPQEALRYE